MERVRDYGGFIVWFIGAGYLAAWAMASDRLAAMPTGLHAIGLTAVAFLPWRLWVQARARRVPSGPVQPIASATRAVLQGSRQSPPRRRIEPRKQFGLRGMPPQSPRR
jgi:hypothetical protein